MKTVKAKPKPKSDPGMVISLPGVLTRAATACDRQSESQHLAFPLRQLLGHLRVVRKSPERLNEFFALWVDDEEPANA